MTLIILAQITAKPGKEELVGASLRGLIAPTLAEEGCLFYDLHTNNTDPCNFVFYEAWETRDLWQAHLKTPHIAAHQKATEGAIADVVVSELTKVG